MLNSKFRVFCGVFSPDGRSFVTATQDHIIRIINVDKVDGSEEIIETEDGRKETIPLSRRGDQVIRKRLSIGAGGWSILDLALAPDSQTGKFQSFFLQQFDEMTRVILAPNDVLTPFDLRAQMLRVNVELSAYYRGQFFFRNNVRK